MRTHQIPPALSSEQDSMMNMRQMLPTYSQHLPGPLGSGSPTLCNSHSAPDFYCTPPPGHGGQWGQPGPSRLLGLQWISNHLNTLQGRGHPPPQSVSESTTVPGCVPDGTPGLPGIKVPRHAFAKYPDSHTGTVWPKQSMFLQLYLGGAGRMQGTGSFV